MIIFASSSRSLVFLCVLRKSYYREYFALEPTVNAEAKGNNLSMMK
jgi:hypothetical protein